MFRPGLYLVPCMEGRGKVLPHALEKRGDVVVEWVPNQKDIYANDWTIVPLAHI